MPKRIFIVNDSQEILELYQELLGGEGYEVITSSVTIRDLDIVRQANPDLIILDYIIEGEKIGWQVIQMLKMTPDLSHIPAIICTAATQMVKEMEAHLTNKGVGIVLKPFDIEDLFDSVERVLNPVNAMTSGAGEVAQHARSESSAE